MKSAEAFDPAEIERLMPRGLTFRPPAVARLFGVTPSTIYRMIDRGELDATRVCGGLRISRSSLAAYIAKTRAEVDFADLVGRGR